MSANSDTRTGGYLVFIVLLIAVWSAAWMFVPNPARVVYEYWHFFLLGLVGALAANSTGAGGGIVFIPAFTALGLSETNSLGTSLAIQCFGMTIGSISWLFFIHNHHRGNKTIKLTYRLLSISAVSAVAGMLCGQYLFSTPSFPVATIFRYFSIFFGIALLLVTLHKHPRKHTRYTIRHRDTLLITLVGFAGGAVTSWISVGAGEGLALLLFFLGFPTMVSVCVAVCISSVTVLSGIPFHAFIAESISWEILLFAAPAAMIGGSVARLLAERLGPVRLKIFFATWILATGFAMV